MGDNLTKQDIKFVEKVIETGNLTQSAQEAYEIENYDYARLKGHRQITKDNIKNAIQTLADRIPDDKLHSVLMEGLNAGKTIYKNNNATKQVEEVGVEADYAVRHKYLDTALKLKGAYENDETKNINVLMPVLVKFLDKREDKEE